MPQIVAAPTFKGRSNSVMMLHKDHSHQDVGLGPREDHLEPILSDDQKYYESTLQQSRIYRTLKNKI